ncbi:hypothetical protein L596_005092 [Steinernema carpocapsae]|nr:hypothetical protein L596_005092 [Steinernema carpocapsae]
MTQSAYSTGCVLYPIQGLFLPSCATSPQGRISPDEKSKKIRRNRTAFSDDQLDELEKNFLKCQYPDSCARERMSKKLSIHESRIQVWFKNRRAKHRKQKRNEPRTTSPEALSQAPAKLKENTVLRWTPNAFGGFLMLNEATFPAMDLPNQHAPLSQSTFQLNSSTKF